MGKLFIFTNNISFYFRFRKGFTKVFRFCLPSCWRKRNSLQIYRYSCSSPDTRVFRNGKSLVLSLSQIMVISAEKKESKKVVDVFLLFERHTSSSILYIIGSAKYQTSDAVL